MKKIQTFPMILLLFFAISGWAGEDKAKMLSDLNEKLEAAGVTKARVDYDYGMVFAYQCSTAGWWTALAIYNFSSRTNSMMVGFWDTNGEVTGRKYFTLTGHCHLIGILGDLVETGSITPQGAITIFGTEIFMVEKFTGNLAGGFGEVEKLATFF